MPRFPIVLFDLDGTLIESGRGILHAIRRMLEEEGHPIPSEAQLKACVGPPLSEGFSEVLHIPPERLQAAIDGYRRWNLHPSTPPPVAYPGIPELLDALRTAGMRTGVATCKIEPTALEHVRLTGLAPRLDAVRGLAPEEGRKSKADVIRALLAYFGAKPEEAVLIGDRKHDCEGAKEAGIACIGVLYGYGTREELAAYDPIALVESPEALLGVLQA